MKWRILLLPILLFVGSILNYYRLQALPPIYFSFKVFIITFFISSFFEILALNTRVNIFGCRYKYLKQPLFKYRIFNLPIIIPFFWAVAKVVFPSFWQFIILDLFFDPAAIRAKFWEFKRNGLWFGVPLTNYIGWAIVWLTVEGVLWLVN